MPRITNIRYADDKDRYWIYIDNGYCTSIRGRTFPAMNLKVDQEITCAELKELESFHWKQQYGESAWTREKVRLDKVKQLIEQLEPRVDVEVVGFGADSTELIEEHPEESGTPDLAIRTKQGGLLVAEVEVTGTETMRGTDYWVRPDKLEYAKNHPDRDTWVILHFAEPREKFVAIKPNPNKHYSVAKMSIRNSTEYYVLFTDASPEVQTMDAFGKSLTETVDSLLD